MILRGGVGLIQEAPAPTGASVDLTADSMAIWRRVDGKNGAPLFPGPQGEIIEDANALLEIYLEGNVISPSRHAPVRGQRRSEDTYRAKQAYFDMRTGRFIALEAELDMSAPGLIAPTKMFSAPRIDQYPAARCLGP